jgi:tetratricopeptide (TPR) repeat protein
MISAATSVYEELSPEAAARVDAVCDGFERAWKAARSGAGAPLVSTFLDGFEGAERAVLTRELLALDRACWERYGALAHVERSEELGAAPNYELNSSEATHRRESDRSAGLPVCWPEVEGLEFLEVLGSGGMGVVFKARQVSLGRDVAVKFLRDAHRAEPGRRQRFVQEARAIARLRHQHLVQLFEFGEVPAAGEAGSQPYLVLEYVRGGSLANILRGSPQPPGEAARLLATLADAIHYAHQQGVIHRDLKPANVLLDAPQSDAEGQFEGVRDARFSAPRPLSADVCAKVTDFGVAKFLAGGDLTHSGDVVGTPSYMAPEQASGTSTPITAAVDVYGLGAILYEALTGHPPFAAATVEATLGMVREVEPVPPRRLQPTVPRDLETICLKCLRKEAGRRYATAQALADDLRRFQAGEPVKARPVGTAERVIVWCRRKPAFAGLLAALVLVFMSGTSGVLWQWQRARANAARAEQHAAAFRRERDIARSEKERAQRHLDIVLERVGRLKQLGTTLLWWPETYRGGQAVLQQALDFYEALLPDEGDDPVVRRGAARLYDQVASIHHTLGQTAQAVEAWGSQASLLTGLLAEDPGSKELRVELADSHRWRGNALRDLGKTLAAREAYDHAARLQEALLRESPDEPQRQLALANTLLNTIELLSHREHAGEIDTLFRRILELDRAGVRAEPKNANYNAELALALGDQGMFFLHTGKPAQAEAAAREAVQLYERLLAKGELKRSVERYAARNFVNLGRILDASGQFREAEQSFWKAVKLFDQVIADMPQSAVYPRVELARALPYLADLLKRLGRSQALVEVRRRLVDVHETLRDRFPEDPGHRMNLAQSGLEMACLLQRLGRQAEAAKALRKALKLAGPDLAVNNDLAWFLATGPEPALRDAAMALRLAQEVVKAQPQSANYVNTLGVAHFRVGDDRAAVAELEKSASMTGGGPLDWFFLAMAHWRLGQRDKARNYFDRSVAWIDARKLHDDELDRIHAEAQALLAGPTKH